MSAIRIQIHLKYMLDENSSKLLYNFWYAFHPSKLLTIHDVLQDIQLNYLKPQLSAIFDKNEYFQEHSLIIHLDDCQLLPFTSSQILRDNDKLILMPFSKYQLHRKTLQDTIQLNASSTVTMETALLPQPVPISSASVPQIDDERQSMELTDVILPSQPSACISIPTSHCNEEPQAKKSKTKERKDSMVVSPVKPVELKESESQIILQKEAPISMPSNSVRLKEIKSKTAKWKEQKPAHNGNEKNKLHIRFDSGSDEDSSPSPSPAQEKLAPALINGQNVSHEIENHSPAIKNHQITQLSQSNGKVKKTLDLLFEMKQHKSPLEKPIKRIQQQFAKKRAQHKKRALTSISMANFIDQAFGVTQSDSEKECSINRYQSISTPQSLPTSFSKLARLPLVAEAIETNDKTYDLYPPLSDFPPIKARIAFTQLELGEDFCPTMSNFKEGTVINVNKNTGELTLQLDQPLETVFDQPSKFYAPPDDRSDEDSTTITVQYLDLHSVRLLSTS